MTDWDMVVESWPGGRHNFPKVTPKNPPHGPEHVHDDAPVRAGDAGPVHLRRSRHAVEHGRPQPDRRSSIAAMPTNDYRGRATISNGTVQIQSYQPFRMDMQSRFTLERREGALRPHGPRQRRRPDGRRPATSISGAGPSSSTSSSRRSTFRRRRTSSSTGRSSTSRASAISPGPFISSRADAS